MGNAKVIPVDPKALFLPFQKRWIEDDSRMKLAEKSRQIGWTWSASYRVCRLASVQGGLKLDHWISSRDETQAKLFLGDCKGFAKVLQVGANDLGAQVLEGNQTAFKLTFATGVDVYSMSSSPDAQAGKRGPRYLDEFALHRDPRLLYSIAYPGITWGGSMEIFSTHRGKDNFFNQLIEEAREGGNPKGFSLHRVTLEDALNQGLLYKLQQKLPADDPRQAMDEAAYFDFIKAGCADGSTFDQEYMCVPEADGELFLNSALLVPCLYPKLFDYERLPRAGGHFYLGVDVGVTHDLTVIWMLEKVGNVFYTVGVKAYKKTKFNDLKRDLWRLLEMPGVRRCCIDRGGVGADLAQTSQERFGSLVEGIHFTAAVKEQLAYPLRMLFEDQRILVPDKPEIVKDLRSIRKITTAAGNVRLDAERTKDGHGDYFWALALAAHGGMSAKDLALPMRWGRQMNLTRTLARGERFME